MKFARLYDLCDFSQKSLQSQKIASLVAVSSSLSFHFLRFLIFNFCKIRNFRKLKVIKIAEIASLVEDLSSLSLQFRTILRFFAKLAIFAKIAKKKDLPSLSFQFSYDFCNILQNSQFSQLHANLV